MLEKFKLNIATRRVDNTKNRESSPKSSTEIKKPNIGANRNIPALFKPAATPNNINFFTLITPVYSEQFYRLLRLHATKRLIYLHSHREDLE